MTDGRRRARKQPILDIVKKKHIYFNSNMDSY